MPGAVTLIVGCQRSITLGVSVALLMSMALVASAVQAQDNLSHADIIASKCGSCHDLGMRDTTGKFSRQIAEYTWPSMPLRVWLSNHHRPRLPSIYMTESDVVAMEAYIASIVSGDPLPSGVPPDPQTQPKATVASPGPAKILHNALRSAFDEEGGFMKLDNCLNCTNTE
jgi:hypothetical protein